jgi:diketogulonate reductase-like aldo/keto reductase
MKTIETKLDLLGGTRIPQLGLGVFEAGRGKATQNAVLWALDAGYRHIDTAKVYGNEAEVGSALQSSGVPREDVFLTTKVFDDD